MTDAPEAMEARDMTQPDDASTRAALIERRLEEFERAILSLARGHFDDVPEMTGEDEMLDAIASGIAMLGEELRATTVSKDYLDDLLDAMLDILIVLAPDGTVLQANRAAREVLGFEETDLIGRQVGALFVGEVPSISPHRLAGLRDAGPTSDVQATMTTNDGGQIPVLLSLSNMAEQSTSELSTRIVLVARDITERSRAQREIERANRDLENLVHVLEHRTQQLDIIGELGEVLQSCHTTGEAFEVLGSFLPKLFSAKRGAVCLTTPSGNVLEAHTTWHGFPDDARERVFSPDQCWALRRGRAHFANTSERGAAVRCRHVDADFEGSYVCIPMLAQSEAMGVLHIRTADASEAFGDAEMRVAHTVTEHIALALSNITLRESLRSQSIRDPLTGLFNRRYMEETMERELHRATRAGGTLGMIMLDIDHFKSFNDTFGHEAGDAVLREVAGVLSDQTRGEDIACRIGGEEFAVILPDASLEDTFKRADDLRAKVSGLKLQYRRESLATVTMSAGVAAAPEHGKDFDALLRAADSALYRAKAEGRDRVVAAPIL